MGRPSTTDELHPDAPIFTSLPRAAAALLAETGDARGRYPALQTLAAAAAAYPFTDASGTHRAVGFRHKVDTTLRRDLPTVWEESYADWVAADAGRPQDVQLLGHLAPLVAADGVQLLFDHVGRRPRGTPARQSPPGSHADRR